MSNHEPNVAYIELSIGDREVCSTVEGDGFAIDFDEDGGPIGLEILDTLDSEVISAAFAALAREMFPDTFDGEEE